MHRFTRKWENFRDRLEGEGRILLAGQVRPGALEGGGGARVRRYVRLAGHDKFTAWLTICPPRAAFGTEPLVHPREGRRGWFDADATFII